MASRCGDLDPAVVLHLQNTLGLSTKEVDTLMNKKSGESALRAAPLSAARVTDVASEPARRVRGARCSWLSLAALHGSRAEGRMLTQGEPRLVCVRCAGLLGLCGASDVRGVLALRDKGEPKGTLALDMLVYR